MKTILLPVDQSEGMLSALETSWLAANLCGGTVEGVALRPAFTSFVASDGTFAFDSYPGWNEDELCHSVRQIFDTFAAGHSASLDHDPQFHWRGGSALGDEALGSLARAYDVTVLSRPGNRNVGMSVLEAALFDSGRPVLMAPPMPPKSLGENILIHWNASTEIARAIEFAIPILRQAKRVSMIAVEGHIFPGPSAKDALRHLADNGISATEKTAMGFRNRQGEAILAEAVKIGADLLIKGAYAQSRLRQMIFGGATRHILDAAELPVFLAH